MAIETGRLKEAFLAAVEITDPVARREWIERTCGDDPELQQRLRALLEGHDQPAPLVAAPSAGLLFDHGGNGESLDRAGQILSCRYKLLEQIGEGGMGSVWVAEQLEPVRRKVALKLIKAGMDTRSVISRFEVERQALAVMDHPNIAKVLDGGVTETGRPFFVMEYVKGLPLTQYCDEYRLSIVNRLKLFVPVCQAVQHAHQKGILHRDLKPSNILICMYDGQPIPKVIDFGLAKALNQPLTNHSVYTAHGIMLGTPTYMSPEQAEFNNLDIDTRSDVYSLGVILYELLTGTTPLEQQRFRDAAWLEMLRLIKEEEPPRPSTRLSGSGSLPSVAAQRHIEPAKLMQLVKGELDWIVMKCLDKDRSRRYDSADGLADDVQRYLADELVMAQPPSAMYRCKKFIRRNRGRVIAAGLVFLTLVAGLVGTVVSLVEARHQTQLAVMARNDEAVQRQRAVTAEAVSVENEQRAWQLAESERIANDKSQQRLAQIQKANLILQSIFTELNPHGNENEVEPLGAILAKRLDEAAAALDAESIGDELTVAKMQSTLGISLKGLGLPGKAIGLLEKAQATLAKLLGPEDQLTLNCQSNLADCYLSNAKRDAALKMHGDIFQIRKNSLGLRDPDTLFSLDRLAECHRIMGKLDEALPLFLQSLKLCEEVYGPDHVATISAMHGLALALWDDGQTKKALELFTSTWQWRKEKLGEDHPATLTSLSNMAMCHHALGHFDRALELYERALDLKKQRLGSLHRDTLKSMNNLAALLHQSGKLDESVLLFEELLRKRTDAIGADHPDTLMAAVNLAINYLDAGRATEALPLFQRAVAAASEYPELLKVESDLADCLCQLGRQDDAVAMFKSRISEAREKLPAGSSELADRLTRLGWLIVQMKLNALDEAGTAFRDSLTIYERIDPDAWDTCSLRALLGAVLLRQEKFAEAEPLLIAGFKGMEQRAEAIPDTIRNDRFREAVENLVELYRVWGKLEQAAPWQKKLDSLNPN